MMRNRKKTPAKVLLVIVGIGLLSLAVMLLWNWLIPTIFGLITINFWQALGLLALSKIFFSGFSRRGRSPRGKKHWKGNFEAKMDKIPEAKREQYMQRMERKGFGKRNDKQ